ncbi:MAG: Crp/Fnr family transcriptional regulator [Cellulosilyticaceae bacterium]
MVKEDGLRKFVRQVPLFSTLQEPLFEMLVDRARFHSIPKGGVICKKGNPSLAMYIIHTGSVGEFIEADNGVETIMKIRHPEDYFGELGMLSDELYITTTVALQRTGVVEIPKAVFMQVVQQDVSVNQYIIRVLIERLRRSAMWQMNFLYLDAPGKLAYTLIKLGGEQVHTERAIHITQDELASSCGLARQTVAKILGEWRRSGWIHTDRGKLILINKEALLEMITNSAPR